MNKIYNQKLVDLEEKLLTEILKCHKQETNAEGMLDFSHPPMSQGDYQDGLIYALLLVREKQQDDTIAK
jgi:hypothetical protein